MVTNGFVSEFLGSEEEGLITPLPTRPNEDLDAYLEKESKDRPWQPLVMLEWWDVMLPAVWSRSLESSGDSTGRSELPS
jgi:hypothetical protein